MFVQKEVLTALDAIIKKTQDSLSAFYGTFGGKSVVTLKAREHGVSVEAMHSLWLVQKKPERRDTQKRKNIRKLKEKKKILVEKIKAVNAVLKSSDKSSIELPQNLAKREVIVSQIRKLNKTPSGKAVISENSRKHKGPAYQRRKEKRKKSKVIIKNQTTKVPIVEKPISREQEPFKRVQRREWRLKLQPEPSPAPIQPLLGHRDLTPLGHYTEMCDVRVMKGGGKVLIRNSRQVANVGDLGRYLMDLTEAQRLNVIFEGFCQLGPIYYVGLSKREISLYSSAAVL